MSLNLISNIFVLFFPLVSVPVLDLLPFKITNSGTNLPLVNSFSHLYVSMSVYLENTNLYIFIEHAIFFVTTLNLPRN